MGLKAVLILSISTLAACDKTPPADKEALKIFTELRMASPECDPLWVTTLKSIDDKRGGQDGFTAHADVLAALEFFEKTPTSRGDLDEKFAAYLAAHAKELESRELVSRIYDAPCDSFHRFGVVRGLAFTSPKWLESADRPRLREQLLRYVEHGSIPWILDIGLRARALANAIEQKIIQTSAENAAQVNAISDAITQKAREASEAQKQLKLPDDTKNFSQDQRKALLGHFADEAAFSITQQTALRAVVKNIREGK